MTSQGSPYARFQPALRVSCSAWKPSYAWIAATEVEYVDLQDALMLVLLRGSRVPLRGSLGAFAEIPSTTLRQVQLVSAALTGQPDRAAASALAAACDDLASERAAAATRSAYSAPGAAGTAPARAI